MDLDDLRPGQAGTAGLRAFRTEHGALWSARLDKRRNVLTLLYGGAIPFIPGNANTLRWEDFGSSCRDATCLPVATIETLTRSFLDRYQGLIGIDPRELVLEASSVGPVAHMVYATYQQVVNGVPVEGAVLRFAINRGNLLQVSTSRLAPVRTGTTPAFEPAAAYSILGGYLGGFPDPADRILDAGSLVLVPITPDGVNPEGFDGPAGAGLTHALAYRVVFERADVTGTWEALIDAHTGTILRFVDTNRYGRVHGGVYPGDDHTGAADRPFPYAQTGLPAPNDYADEGGRFPGDSATVDLRYGKYTWVNDSCGPASLATTNGNADYAGFPDPVGTNCEVPSPNPGGAGNTMSARTQYYHLTMANIKARTYYPNNSWLNTNHMNVNVNQSPWCNATSGGGTLNFYQSASGCWNLGELPGVSVHEWGHSWDDYDESGGSSPPVETRADWTASVLIHDSCVGRGFYYPSGNCSGYGDSCLDCSGIRDADYWKHTNKTPWTAANHGSFWSCSGGSYFGPCGLEDHCESGISTQALWEMVKGPRTPPEPNGDFFAQCGLDVSSGWQLMDRLYWTSHAALDSMYSCTLPNSTGCTGDTLYNLFMAIDDDGDGVGNGTPHAAGIFAALNRHNIACGAATDPQNKNQETPACLPLARPQNLAALGQNNQIILEWNPVANATRYEILRNETGCGAGFTRVATVDAPATTSTDDGVVNGITYYYRVQPYYENPPSLHRLLGPDQRLHHGDPGPLPDAGRPGRADGDGGGRQPDRALVGQREPGFVRLQRLSGDWRLPPDRVHPDRGGRHRHQLRRRARVGPARVRLRRDRPRLHRTLRDRVQQLRRRPDHGDLHAVPRLRRAPERHRPGELHLHAEPRLGRRCRLLRRAPPVPGLPQHHTGVPAVGREPARDRLVNDVQRHECARNRRTVLLRRPRRGHGQRDGGPELRRTLRPADGTADRRDLDGRRRGLRRRQAGPRQQLRRPDRLDGFPVAEQHPGRIPRVPVRAAPGCRQPVRSGSGRQLLGPALSAVGDDRRGPGLVLDPVRPRSELGRRRPRDAGVRGRQLHHGDLAGHHERRAGSRLSRHALAQPDRGLQRSEGLRRRLSLPGRRWDRVDQRLRLSRQHAGIYGEQRGMDPVHRDASRGLRQRHDAVPVQPLDRLRVAELRRVRRRHRGHQRDGARRLRDGQRVSRQSLRRRQPRRTADPLRRDRAAADGLVGGRDGSLHVPVDGGRLADPGGHRGVLHGPRRRGPHVQLQGPGPRLPRFRVRPDRRAGHVAVVPDLCRARDRDQCDDQRLHAEPGLARGGLSVPRRRDLLRLPQCDLSRARHPGQPGRRRPATTAYADTEGLASGTTYHYVVRAVAVSTGVEDGNTVERSGSPTGITEVVFADGFENGNLGWTFARGTPAASAGDFVIGDPVGTIGNNSQPSQPEDDHTAAPGVACLYTAPNPAGSVGADDVDNGEVVATSRVINLSGYSAATLSLWRWFENEDPDDAGDYYVLEVSNNGTTWVPLETIPDTVTTTNTWTRVQFDLQTFVTLTSTMRIRFRVADGPALGDIVEFAADDIEISGNRSCTAGA